MDATKGTIELVRELGFFNVTWENVQCEPVSELVFVVTDKDYETKNEGFLGYILEQSGAGGKAHWKECSQKYQFDCQAYKFTSNGKLCVTPIRNEEVIKTIGVTKWAIMKRKMNAIKELYNAEADLQKLLADTKQNTPTKPSETVFGSQKSNSESLKLPVNWAKKLEDNNEQVKLLVNDLMLSIAEAFSDLSTEPSADDLQLYKGQTGSGRKFAVLTLRKDGISIRLRTNPRTLVDPQKWITEKTYKYCFNDGNGEEKEIKITQKEQIGYTLELLKQSYSLVK